MKVVLAFSGGLDTSVILRLLQERMGAEVVTVTMDVRQRDDFNAIEEKTHALGLLGSSTAATHLWLPVRTSRLHVFRNP